MAIPGNFLSSTTESVDPNTSGWTPLLNCTLTLGIGGRNGDGCLSVKAVAVGETQVRTVSSYNVVPGTVYHTFADAAGANEPERIGIRWLTSAGAEISITWSLTTEAASASWHRVSVAGPAPAGAARAQVILGATPASTSTSHYWENVYLGLPKRIQSNLFPFNTESSEIDVSGWEADTNATVTRAAPVVHWAVDSHLVGGHVVRATASGAGDMAVRSADRAPVTPGMEYTLSAYLNPPVATTTAAWIELRFYDAADSQIEAHRATLDAPGTSWYRQYVSATAPAAAAACGVAFGRESATAGQVVHAESISVRPATALAPGTVIPEADGNFEAGIGPWTVVSGVATLARSSPWGAHGFSSMYSLTASSATATQSRIRSAAYPVTELVSWRPHVFAKPSAGGGSIAVGVRWLDAGAAEISTEESDAAAIPADGQWWGISADFTAPAGAVTAQVDIVYTASASSSVMQLDIVSLRQVLPLTSVEAEDERGSVTLTLRELDPGDTITVYRETGGQRTLVRGPDGLLDGASVTSELLVFEDYEAPLGVEVRYRIELRGPGVTTPDTRTSSLVTLDPGDTNLVWLKDPGAPHRNLRVMVQRAPDWDRPIEQAAHRVAGRRNPVVLSSVRGGLQGELAIWTRDDDERAALHWLLDSGAVLLWQAAPGHGVDDVYVSVGAVTEARTTSYALEPWRAWSLALTEVDMPTTVGVGSTAGRSWQDVLSGYDTWADVESAYDTWEDVMFDTPAGG